MQILLARQPIFDRTEGLYGYDLILRRSDGRGTGGDLPPERLVVDTFLGIGIDQVPAGHRAFVTIDRDMPLSGAVRLLPAERVVLQIAGKVSPDSEMLGACGELVGVGHRTSARQNRNLPTLPNHSARKASVGSTRVARRPGR